MKINLSILIIMCVALVSGCSYGIFDWNQKYLQEQNEEAINSGYVFNGTDEQAEKVGRQCKVEFKDLNLYKKCLLENGYKKSN